MKQHPFAAGLFAAGLLLSIAPPVATAADAPAGRPVLTVSTVSPMQMELPRRIGASGTIAAWQEAIIGAESAIGRLASIGAEVGQSVKRGQVLAVANTELAQAELEQLRAALEEATAALEEASANAERARQIAGTGALSPQQMSQYMAAERSARARVSAQTAAMRAQALRIRNATIVAPDDGVISSRTAAVGTVVAPGQELFRLIRQGRLEWRAEVGGADLMRIVPGQEAVAELPDGTRVKGTVRMLGPVVDAGTRNGLVYVDLINAGKARPGQFARGEFELGAAPALTVPQAAVQMRDGFQWVFVVGKESRVNAVKIDIGRRWGDRIEVVSGLTPDARIIATGTGFLSDGDLVKVVDQRQAAK